MRPLLVSRAVCLSIGGLLAALLLSLFLVQTARAATPLHVEIGATAVCALTDDGEIECWGFDIPLVRDAPEGAFSDLSLGPTDACAITTQSTVVCWGEGYARLFEEVEGLLSREPEANLEVVGLARLLPSERSDLVQVVVHSWRHYACARTEAGEIVCWGLPPPDRPAPEGGGFTQLINAGREFCALDAEGGTTCWGDQSFEQFVSDAGPFVSIAPSGNGVCGITESGDVRCRTARARTAPGPPQPVTQLFRNVHLLGSQGCAIVDGALQCRQVHHQCIDLIAPQIDYCPPDLIRFTSWSIPFTVLFEGGPDSQTTEARSYSRLFGDQAACAITVDGEIDCWSDYDDDPRHAVPQRFRPAAAVDESEANAEESAGDS